MKFIKILWVGLGLILLGFASYLIVAVFGYEGKELEQLAYFSTYQGYFLALVNVILVGFISFLVYRSTDSFNKYQMSPILDFSVKQVNTWYLMNCSNAAARNISIRFYGDYGTSSWISCLTLAGGGELELKWLRNIIWIEVVYANPTNTIYKLARFDLLHMKDVREITEIEMNQIINDRFEFFNVNLWYDRYFSENVLTIPSYYTFFEKHICERLVKMNFNMTFKKRSDFRNRHHDPLPVDSCTMEICPTNESITVTGIWMPQKILNELGYVKVQIDENIIKYTAYADKDRDFVYYRLLSTVQ